MTHTTHTQAAAARCADLANAAEGHSSDGYMPEYFIGERLIGSKEAFRKYVERKDAEAREVLALLATITVADMGSSRAWLEAGALLRADLLPTDPQPTLQQEFEREWGHCESKAFMEGAFKALDWIAKRQEKEA